MVRKTTKMFATALESLEERLCLATSVGWDGVGQGDASLTYYIGSVPSSLGLSQSAVENALRSALNAWAAVADVTFTRTTVPNQRDSIDLTFVRIDGAGRTLAQGYYPDDVNPARIAGDVQFDSSERWEIGNAQGSAAIDLVYVAVHEIGHALGLDHSNAAGSVMAPSASANQSFNGLAPADVNAILTLYAPADSTSTTNPSAVASTNSQGSDPDAETPVVPSFPRRWRPRGFWFRVGERHPAGPLAT
jgi:hypothetical protein